MTRYRTLVSDDLMAAIEADDRQLPAGFRLVGRVDYTPTNLDRALGWPPAGMQLVEFDDDDAPPELAGHVVTPTFSRNNLDGTVTIMQRVDDCPTRCSNWSPP
jgi:hypothetical protein